MISNGFFTVFSSSEFLTKYLSFTKVSQYMYRWQRRKKYCSCHWVIFFDRWWCVHVCVSEWMVWRFKCHWNLTIPRIRCSALSFAMFNLLHLFTNNDCRKTVWESVERTYKQMPHGFDITGACAKTPYGELCGNVAFL